MAAICTNPDCGWDGKSSQVVDGGKCPSCWQPVRYGDAPLAHDSIISTTSEFNRRVLPVLRSISCSGTFVPHLIGKLSRGYTPTDNEQQALYRVINRHHRQVADKAVLDFSTFHARGSDQ